MHGRSKSSRGSGGSNPIKKSTKTTKPKTAHKTTQATIHTKTTRLQPTTLASIAKPNTLVSPTSLSALSQSPITTQQQSLQTTAPFSPVLSAFQTLHKRGLIGSLNQQQRRRFANGLDQGHDELSEDGPSLGPSQPAFQDRTIKLKDIKREYLMERPEIAIRAQFARIPTREEVTGLTPDHGRDTARFEHPGNKKFREDNFIQLRTDQEIKFISADTTQATLKLALNTSENKLTESLLSLAVAEPAPYRPSTALTTAETNIEHQLNIAPDWDVDDPQAEEMKQFRQVRSSEKIFRGDLTHAQSYIAKRAEEAKADNLPYFQPTGNVQIDEMNRRNLAKGILPIPNFAGDSNAELTPDDITQIDQMAQSLARHVEVTTSAKQPYDTAHKIVKKRLESLPSDPDEFFAAAGFPTVESRTPHAYIRYLKLVSVKGTVKQALDIWDEIRTRGIVPNTGLLLNIIATMGLKNATQADNARMMKEMMVNKVNPDKIANYVMLPDWMSHITLWPKASNPVMGAPEGFISSAPQVAKYGADNLRGHFNVPVEYAFYLLEKAKENNMIPDRMLMTQIIQVCGEHAQFERAFAVFEEFKRYAEGQYHDPKLATNKREIALAKPFRDAKLEGFKPDQMMAVALMRACFKSNQGKLVEETFHRFWEEGMQPNAPMYNQVILSCIKGGYVEKAFKYFEQLQHFGHTPSIITYTSLIMACSAPDRPEFYPKAFEVFHECISAGFRPDEKLFQHLMGVTADQCDVHNLVSIFRLMTRDFPHLITMDTYITMAKGLAKSMSNEKLPGFGGYVLTRTGRTLFGQTFTGDKNADSDLTGKNKIKLTREDRLAMIDALYSEVALRTESHDRTGTQGGKQFAIDEKFLDAIVSGYALAACGILQWDRHERKEGREDPLLRLTPTHINQLIERTWGKVVTLQKQHPHVFKLSSDTYNHLFDMYGSADRLDDAVYHLLYLTRGLKINVHKSNYVKLLEWCKKNAHHGPGFIILEEMARNKLPAEAKWAKFFQAKEDQMNTPLVPNAFPGMRPDPEDRQAQWQQPRRDKRTGKMINHPMDWDGSYKDF